MSKVKYLLIIVCFIASAVHAQNTRLSMELFGGVPTLTFFTPTVTTYGGLGLNYGLIKEISLGAQISIGTFSGKNNGANNALAYPDNNDNYKGFSNNFYQFTLNGQINLERVFNLRRAFHRLNPYLVFGTGIVSSNVKADRVNGSERSYSSSVYYTYSSGLLFKYYLNPSLDFMLGANYNLAQTYYNDAVPLDNKYDNYITSYVGVSYKFGSRKDKQHIDWNNVILKDRIYIPDIEKRQGQPVDAAGNFFIFHKDSIAKIQAQGIVLQAKTEQLESKSAEQQIQIDSMQNDVKKMQTKMDTLQNQMDQLKEQVSNPNNKSAEKANNNVIPVSGTDKKQVNASNKVKPVTTNNHQPVSASEKPVKSNTEIVSNDLTEGLNKIDDIVAPVSRYNIIVGAYTNKKYAYAFRDKMRADGYEAAIFKSNINSRMLRVCVYTSENRNEALNMMKKVKAEVNPDAWIHIYNPK